MTRYTPMLLLAVILASALQASAASASVPRAARMLIQDAIEQDHNEVLIKGLQAVKNGDKKEREVLVFVQYMILGCGGQTRERDPEDVADDVRHNIQQNPKFVKAGVVNTWLKIIDDAIAQVHHHGPSAKECDKFYGTHTEETEYEPESESDHGRRRLLMASSMMA